jgi:hypothetical protein
MIPKRPPLGKWPQNQAPGPVRPPSLSASSNERTALPGVAAAPFHPLRSAIAAAIPLDRRRERPASPLYGLFQKEKHMSHDRWFDSDENRTLMAICARKLIKNIGVGAVIWGLINVGIGVVALKHTYINVGILILAVMMLGTGVQALRSPSLGVLLTQTIVTVLLFVWNLGISLLNLLAAGMFDPTGLILPLIVAVVFARYYWKLGHLRELIASVEPEEIAATKQVCKTLLKRKLKDEPRIVQTTNRKCRGQLMDDRAFFIQRDLMRAFVGSRNAIRSAVHKPEAKRLTMIFNHPLGKLTYRFDKKNSEKLRSWLSAEPGPTAA